MVTILFNTGGGARTARQAAGPAPSRTGAAAAGTAAARPARRTPRA
jgi:hypothetical protein